MFDYIGGKKKIGKWIANNLPDVKWKRYTEVFGGAMGVYLTSTSKNNNRDIDADEIYYNDINPFLTNLWWVMKERDPLIDFFRRIDTNKLDDLKRFKKFQEYHDQCLIEVIDIEYPDLRLAVIMLYILTHCWSGNITRQGCGNPKTKVFRTWEKFIRVINNNINYGKIQNIIPLNLDFVEVFKRLDIDGGCFYVDPPYMGLETEYYTKKFPEERHYELAEILKDLKSFWVLSYYPNYELEKLYPKEDFIWRYKKVTKTAAAQSKEKEIEIIIMPREKYENYEKLIKIRHKNFF